MLLKRIEIFEQLGGHGRAQFGVPSLLTKSRDDLKQDIFTAGALTSSPGSRTATRLRAWCSSCAAIGLWWLVNLSDHDAEQRGVDVAGGQDVLEAIDARLLAALHKKVLQLNLRAVNVPCQQFRICLDLLCSLSCLGIGPGDSLEALFQSANIGMSH